MVSVYRASRQPRCKLWWYFRARVRLSALDAPEVLQAALTRFAADFWAALERPDLFHDDVIMATMIPVLAAWLRGEERVSYMGRGDW